MTIMVGLIVGGLWGRSLLDAILKSTGVGLILGGLIYYFLSPEMIEVLGKRDASWAVGIGTQVGFLLVGAALGFMIRKAYLANEAKK